MSAVGFDIGSENSYIAVIKSGGIEVLDNEYSLRATPTYIEFSEKCRNIGVTARLKLITNLENTVFGFKRILGKKYDDDEIKDELTYLPHEIVELPSGNIGIKVKYLKDITVFSTEQLMAMMLTKLKLITESKLENKIRDCVIAVPVYYTDAQRRAMLDAVNIAGLNAVKLMNESTAIALSYGFFKQNLSDEDSQKVVFVDVGKSCLTVTACMFTKEKVRILGCVWDYVGGRDFDNKLVQYFIDDFKNRYSIDVLTSKKALMTLILECETLKKIMSANSLEVSLQIECFLNDYDVNGKMKREIFEKLSAQVLNKIEMNFHRLLNKTQLKPSDIHSVEIVGGSSRIPAIKELVKKVFGRRPNETLNQDEAIARGCALQSAILSPSLRNRNYILEDIPSYIVKIIWKNKEFSEETLELFSFSDKVPSSKLVTICISKPFSIEAYYVDLVEKLCKIGTFVFQNIPEDIEKNGFMKIKIKACLNVHNIFYIESAKILKRNEETVENDKIDPPVDNTNVDVPMTDKEEKKLSAEQLAQDVLTNCAVKSYDLTVKSEVYSLTKLRLNEFINAEQQMICNDIEEKKKADARNALEEFVYDFRGKLNDELEEFVSKTDKTELLQNLNEIEMWLEEEGELEAAEYIKKFKDLKKLFDPIFLKFTEWKQRQYVIVDYQQALQEGFDTCNSSITKKNLTVKDTKKLLKFLEESKKYLDVNVEKLSQLKKIDEVPITVNELQTSMQAFKANFQNLFFELQEKHVAQEANVSSSGDRLAENTENINSNNIPNEL